MSPQQRRGHSAPQSHKKPAPRPASAAAPKPATGASAPESAADASSASSALPPAQSLPAAQPLSGSSGKSSKSAAAPAKATATPAKATATPAKAASTPAAKFATDSGSGGKAADSGRRRAKSSSSSDSRSTRRGSGLSGTRRNPMLTGAWAYFKAFLPLILVVVIGSVGIIVWTTVTKTETPSDAWTRLETTWQPKRAAALTEIASAGTDTAKQVKGYQNLRDATRGWVKDLGTIKDWTDATKSGITAGEANTAVKAVISDGNTEANYIDGLTAANLAERLTLLYNYEAQFGLDVTQARTLVIGSAAASAQPTLPTPPASPSAPASAGASASVAPSPTAVPTATPAPSN